MSQPGGRKHRFNVLVHVPECKLTGHRNEGVNVKAVNAGSFSGVPQLICGEIDHAVPG